MRRPRLACSLADPSRHPARRPRRWLQSSPPRSACLRCSSHRRLSRSHRVHAFGKTGGIAQSGILEPLANIPTTAHILGGAVIGRSPEEGVVDAAGVSATLKTAMDIVRPAGWISKVGWGRDPLGFSIDPLVQKNVTLQGSFSHTWAIWERVLVLLASRALDVSAVVGGAWSIEDWHDAFETMHSGKIAKAVLEITPELAV